MNKKIITSMIAALFLFSALSVGVVSLTVTAVEGYDATKGQWNTYATEPVTVGDNVYITTAEELAFISWDALNGSTYDGKILLLMNDIDLSAHYFLPIGSYDDANLEPTFKGSFDGQGHTVAGLTVKNSWSTLQGLFGWIDETSYVRNLTLLEPSVLGHSMTGAVAGVSDGTIENCHVINGNIISVNDNCGGIVGYSEGTVTGSYNTGSVNGATSVGGITGYSGGDVTQCYNTGEITGTGNVGGIVGCSLDSIFTECYNTGKITGDTVGGIVGNSSGGSVTVCYNTGSISKITLGGGILGDGIDGVTVTMCYNTGDLSLGAEPIVGDSAISSSDCYWLEYPETPGGGREIDNMTGADALTDSGKMPKLVDTVGDTKWSAIDDADNEFEYLKYTPQLVVFAAHTDPAISADSLASVTRGITDLTQTWIDVLPATHELDWVDDTGGLAPGYFEIKSAWDLAFLSANISSSHTEHGPYYEANYVVMDDIVMSKYMFVTITVSGNIFVGIFDGNDHVIRGMNIRSSSNTVGLFSDLDAAGVISNLGIVDSNVSGVEQVGSIVGNNQGTVSGCFNTGTVSGTDNVGGISGANTGNIEESYNTGTVTGSNNVGGISGMNGRIISQCYNTGSIEAIVQNIGGITGMNNNTITECYNAGEISGPNNVGGIVGMNVGPVDNCYNTAEVNGTTNVGGIIGNLGNGSLSYSYNAGTVTGTTGVGSLIGANSGNLLVKCSWLTGTCAGNPTGTEMDYPLMTGRWAVDNMEFNQKDLWTCMAEDVSGRNFKLHFPQLSVFANNTSDAVKADSKRSVEYIPASITYWTDLDITVDISKGLPEDPTSPGEYPITCALDLLVLDSLISSDPTYSDGKVFRLDANIDLSLLLFKSIGDNTPFDGTFDGNNHTLYGAFSLEGLFSKTTINAVIKDLFVEFSFVTGEGNIKGGIVATNNGIIEGCSFSGTVSGRVRNGGIAGENHGTVRDCLNSGVIGGTTHIGGIVGYGDGAISDCRNIGPVNGKDAVGGIVGTSISSPSNRCDVTGCYNMGAVTGDVENIGGISGDNYCIISGCYNTGTVNGVLIGGIVGNNKGTVTMSYNTGDIMGEIAVGGIVGTNLGDITECYNFGDITGSGDVDPICGDGGGTVTDCYWLNATHTEAGGRTIDEMTGSTALDCMDGFDSTVWTVKANIGTGATTRTVYFPQLTNFATDTGIIGANSLASVTMAVDKSIPDPKLNVLAYTYGDKLSRYSVPTGGADGTYSWVNGAILLDDVTIVSIPGAVSFVPTDTDNYVTCIVDLAVTVSKPVPVGEYTAHEGDVLNTVVITETTPVGDIGGTYAWDDGTQTLTVTGPVTKTLVFTPTNPAHGTFSMDVVVTVIELPKITTQPTDQNAVEGDGVTFTVVATPSGVTYQWEQSIDDGINWTPMIGKTSSALVLEDVTITMNGVLYRCVATFSGKTATSISAKLTVDYFKPVIDTEPSDATIFEGGNATFTIVATSPNTEYQWKAYINSAWENITTPSATTDTLVLTDVSINFDGTEYKCVVTNGTESIDSEIVKLTVNNVKPVIDTQPSDVTVTEGDDATFTIVATSPNTEYQWKIFVNGTWENITTPSGTTATLVLVGVGIDLDGTEYMCVVTNGTKYTDSASAKLTVDYFKPVIDTEPQDTSVFEDGDATFTIVATSPNTEYQWKIFVNGTWENITTPSGTTATLVLVGVGIDLDGTEYMCVVTNGTKKTESITVKLTVNNVKPVIVTEPVDVAITVGKNATFTIVATSPNTEYQWQIFVNGIWEDMTTPTGRTSALVLTNVGVIFDGTLYKCVVTNGTESVDSKSAKLTVYELPAIVTQPRNQTVAPGDTATFIINATPSGAEFRWEKNVNGTWVAVSGGTSSTLRVNDVTLDMNETEYRCVVSYQGESVTSKNVILRIVEPTTTPDITMTLLIAAGAVTAIMTVAVIFLHFRGGRP